MKKEIKKNLNLIASYPKSGNTWLRVFLSYFVKRRNKNTVEINEISDLESTYKGELFSNYSLLDFKYLYESEVDLLRPKIYKSYNQDLENPKYLKTHDTFRLNNEGLAIYPKEAINSVIYIVRNPLDVAVSVKFHNNSNFDYASNAVCNGYILNKPNHRPVLHEQIGSWRENINSWLDSGMPIYTLRYEDLLLNPQDGFSKLLSFLNIECDQETLLKVIEMSSFDNLKKQETEGYFKERIQNQKIFFRKGKINQWKEYLSLDQIDRIVDCNQNTMSRLGYIFEDNELKIQNYEYHA